MDEDLDLDTGNVPIFGDSNNPLDNAYTTVVTDTPEVESLKKAVHKLLPAGNDYNKNVNLVIDKIGKDAFTINTRTLAAVVLTQQGLGNVNVSLIADYRNNDIEADQETRYAAKLMGDAVTDAARLVGKYPILTASQAVSIIIKYFA